MSDEQTFPPFPRLPIEVRRLIWVRALPRGRIQLFAKNVPWEDWRLFPPTIAHVCREAREVVMNHAVVRGFPTARDKHNETWFIGSSDILELASGFPYPLSNPEPFFASAEALAINSGDFEGDVRAVIKDLIEGTRFHSVKVVYLIVDQISTAYWPKFRPDMTEKDKGKGTILDLCDKSDMRKIEDYKVWAGYQEMAPSIPRREDVEFALRTSLDTTIMEELQAYQDRMALIHPIGTNGPVTRQRSRPSTVLSQDHPWVQQQWRRLPEFRPAILVLGWT
ncbi:Uu.00g076840.m01.CDS01 [Anthostomella pinea]|uniref:Uu.00g076840.m01.CDS01 n=1 Tax=Anthostomella pinea TaxID=933095 RepID=A0AAI8VWN1_9PEZI|nr:Uu.00g076840.m01.CDS01 [Anthostomella pinea]